MADGKKLLKTIIDILPLNVYMKDLQSRKTLINKSELNYSKATHESEVLGKNDFDLYPYKNAKISIEEDMEVFNGRKTILNKETTSVDKEGKESWFLTSKIPFINEEDKVMGLIGISYDISDSIAQRQELIQAKKIAEDAKKMQEQFLANMSHEIRTPMNGIQGMTDLLLETNLNDEQKDFAKTIKRSSDNLLVIINDILDFSKIKAGKLTIEKIDFNLAEVVENIKSIFKHRINEKGLGLLLTIHKDVPATLNGDPYRLNQILVNLVGNAIKFTHNGSVKINITVQKKTSKEIVLNFTITDTGIGIANDKLGEMFESFTQASIETSRKYGGTGLGLSITKQLVEMQEGEISVESTIDVGTTFKFSIPYNYCKNESQIFFAGKDVNTYRALLKSKKFLVAEDNLVNQKVIRHVLQKAGGIVDMANNGLQAIEFLKKSTDYNLIIMDLQMPEMDGYAATKYIRNVMNLSIPIIAMTASALKGEKSKCIEIGMNDYLSKPFDFAFIYKRISMLIGDTPIDHNEVIKIPTEEKLFDLSLVEEMDDNEYVVDILSIYLNETPSELNELEKACIAGKFTDVYKRAHKLKSSTGLLKASGLLTILIKIEETAKAEKNDGLIKLSEQAKEEYKKIETPLQQHLKNINTALNITV
jgi:signal transduction histidine kinase/CheY-like chemotaxis protein